LCRRRFRNGFTARDDTAYCRGFRTRQTAISDLAVFQECTGCTESLTRAHSTSIENLIFDAISLDYHHTLQAAAGFGAEAAREAAMAENQGKYLLVVDGSVPLGNAGYSTIAGISNVDMLKQTAQGAAAVIAVGSCAAFGGLPHADPNPTGAVAVSDIITDKPDFWDGGGFYKALSMPTENIAKTVVYTATGAAVVGIAVGALNQLKKKASDQAHEKITVEELNK
jgi:Ni,Fe-hydrogenase I small subunit